MDIDRLMQELTGGCDVVPEDWVPVTALRPLQQQDPFLLWCRYWADLYGLGPDPPDYSLLEFLSKMGILFEQRWVREVMPKAVQVLQHDHDCRYAVGLRRSLEALHSDAQALTKVALWGGPEIGLYGTADIVARAGFLRSRLHLDIDADPDAWVVLDCKFTSKLLEKRLDLEINSTQVRLYSHILSRMVPNQVGKVSRAFLITRDTALTPLPVQIDNATGGSLTPEIIRLRDWAKEIKVNGWQYNPWCDKIVAANFGNDNSEPWATVKHDLMEKMRPLEMLPGIGKARADAMRNVFHDLDDMLARDMTSLNLQSIKGIGPAGEMKIKSALLANRTLKPSVIPASVVPPKKKAVFLDFEFFQDTHPPLDDPAIPFPACLAGVPMIFLCGVGSSDAEGKFQFKNFLADAESHAAEKKMLLEMVAYLEELAAFDPEQSTTFHFSMAEPTCIREAVERHGPALQRLTALPLCDLQAIFRDNAISLPGCWGYGLKPISKAISRISPDHAVEYPPELSQAAVAMVMGWSYYENPYSPEAQRLLETLVAYLKTDCEAMYQALRWLRDNADVSAQPHQPTKQPSRKRSPAKPTGKRPTPKKSRTRSRSKRRASGWYSMTKASMCENNETVPDCLRKMADCAERETGQRISEIFQVAASYSDDEDDTTPPIPMWAYAVEGDPRVVEAWLRWRGQVDAWAVEPGVCTVCRVVIRSQPPGQRLGSGWYPQAVALSEEVPDRDDCVGWYSASIRSLYKSP